MIRSIANVGTTEIVGSLCFAFAILHTFSVKQLQRLSHRYREGTAAENFFHLLGEVEVVFGLWGAFFLLFLASTKGTKDAIHFLEGRDFTEPAFVFVIMTI